MSDRELALVEKAQKEYGRISPCNRSPDWKGSFSRISGTLYFWFNTADNSTHVVALNNTYEDSAV